MGYGTSYSGSSITVAKEIYLDYFSNMAA